MNRKRRTLKFDSFRMSSAYLRFSQPQIAATSQVDPENMVRDILHDIFTQMEQQIQVEIAAIISSQHLLASLDKAFANWHQMEQLTYDLQSHSTCEQEPQPSWQNQRPNDATRAQVRKLVRGNSRRTKEKSQSCDIGEWRQRQKIEKLKWQTQRASQSQRVSHSQRISHSQGACHSRFISLVQNPRNSEGEDRSQEIQQLLRRKKQLQMESKQPQQVCTDAGRSDKKEKKWFWQDDEGAVQELLGQIKPTKESPPAIQLTNIKVLPGQQLASLSNLKRRPIIELPTRKANKRRKNFGDTCILIEQLYEADEIPNQEDVIEQACRGRIGVRIEDKDKARISIVKLPNLR